MDGKANDVVLSEAAATEVLGYLISAARTQMDEAYEYAPMRLMTAARKLADHLAPQASAPLLGLIRSLDDLPLTATPRGDPADYISRLDRICVALADCLVAQSKSERLP
jgi:hypothetical protein